MGPVYRFGPDGLVFDRPVKLTLSYEEYKGLREDFINIYYYEPVTGKLEVIPKAVQDTENNTITAFITHFSEYVPGTGMYKVEEGLTPNSGYFKNNNERVDPYTGNLFIDRTDVSLPGRGVDFVLQSRFSSAKYLDTDNDPDYIMDYYKIAKGWYWKMPVFRKTTKNRYKFFTPDETVFDITYALQQTGEMNNQTFIEGYEVYDMDYESYPGSPSYIRADRRITLIEDKIALILDVRLSPILNVDEAKAYFPDGRVSTAEGILQEKKRHCTGMKKKSFF